MSDPMTTAIRYLARLQARVEELEGALLEIEKVEGRYSMDPLKHCSNTVEDMKALARAALRKHGGEDER